MNPRILTVAPVTVAAFAVAAFIVAACGSASTSGATGSGATGASTTGATGVFVVPPDSGVVTSGTTGGLNRTSCSFNFVVPHDNQLIVLDRSDSMLDVPVGYSMTKWGALTSQLAFALSSSRSWVGLEYFPSLDAPASSDATCWVAPGNQAVDVEVASPPYTAVPIGKSLLSTMPHGASPITAALRAALDYYTSGDGRFLAGPKDVLLFTDGAPDCNPPLDDEAAVAAVRALHDVGIRTAVVGLPGSESSAAVLDAMASASLETAAMSGSHSYYPVGASPDLADLTPLLASPSPSLPLQCAVSLPEMPADAGPIQVSVDGIVVGRDVSRFEGWDLDNTTTPPTVVFFGTACDDVKYLAANVTVSWCIQHGFAD